MDVLWQELGFYNDPAQTLRAVIRLVAALVLGAIIGTDRELRGRAAGLRTHMLVCLGSALFCVVPALTEGANAETLSQLVRGVAAGIGFLGAGAILKSTTDGGTEVRGLTTAASIWLTAAVGLTVGIGGILTASIASVLALIVLALLYQLEKSLALRRNHSSSMD